MRTETWTCSWPRTSEVRFFLVNDGTGNFTRDTTRVDLQGAVFTAELVDVDRDGYVDILASGIESDGFPAQVL